MSKIKCQKMNLNCSTSFLIKEFDSLMINSFYLSVALELQIKKNIS